jgi:epoxyqueuosine reductase
VLEHAIAEKAGIGWTGKHSLTLNKEAGSWFFLGELFINLPLPVDKPVEENCGSCTACLTICPTNAIVAPYKVDARRCISYLTIESDDDIPESLRPLMGNRIYGCDDCQLICPWNRYADVTTEADFHPRQVLHGQSLNTLFSWSEETFLKNTEGSPIRRIGFEKWQRNIAVALGNAPYNETSIALLKEKRGMVSDRVDRHIDWALDQQLNRKIDIQESRQQKRLIRAVEKGLPRDA